MSGAFADPQKPGHVTENGAAEDGSAEERPAGECGDHSGSISKIAYTMGVDIGSSTSKCAILSTDMRICGASVCQGGSGTSGPDKAVNTALQNAGLSAGDISCVAATGYGRNTFEPADRTFSELSCHAAGAAWLSPGVRTVIDIGGQDCKVMLLSDAGKLDSFAMNDKCAAGTGRFLEVMSRVLEVELSDMGQMGEQAGSVAEITSTCTVFAESEIISQLSRGVDKLALLAGIHHSVAVKAASIAKRMAIAKPVFFTGGVSQNIGVVKALAKELNADVKTDSLAQLAGALGAALLIRAEM